MIKAGRTLRLEDPARSVLRFVLVLERVHRPRVQFFEAVVVAVKDLGIHGQR